MKGFSLSTSPKVFGALLALSTTLLATACTPPHEKESSTPVEETSVLTTASASSDRGENAELSITPTTVSEGDQITFNISGLNPELGYYAAICSNVTQSSRPNCTGQEQNTANQAVLSNATTDGTQPIQSDGSAEVTLTATSKGDGLDCATSKCVAKVFNDEAGKFETVAETAVSFK